MNIPRVLKHRSNFSGVLKEQQHHVFPKKETNPELQFLSFQTLTSHHLFSNVSGNLARQPLGTFVSNEMN
jgi:hypothetical protein